jgi:hypothetical protein
MKLTSPHPNRQGEDARFIFFENGKVQIAKLFAVYFYLKKQKQKFQFENFKLKIKPKTKEIGLQSNGNFMLTFSVDFFPLLSLFLLRKSCISIYKLDGTRQ